MTLPSKSSALAAAVAAVGLTVLSASPALANPACRDAVARTLHQVHDTTGDPGGLVHETEEAYCSVAP